MDIDKINNYYIFIVGKILQVRVNMKVIPASVIEFLNKNGPILIF